MGNFSFEIIKVKNDEEWLELIKVFQDSNLLQTISFTKYASGWSGYEVSILKKETEIKSAAIVRLKKIPILGTVAYISWGPLWQKDELNLDVLEIMLRNLRDEYVNRRNFYLIIAPNIYSDFVEEIHQVFQNTNYKSDQSREPRRTLLLDMDKSLDEIKQSFRSKWRNFLNKVEKNSLQIKEGYDLLLYDQFVKLYTQMRLRKNFDEVVDVEITKLIQKELPIGHKLNVLVCYYDEIPLASIVLAHFGNTVTYYLGASNEEGLKKGAPYSLQWRAITWAKSVGAKWYDLGGIDPERNPGGYLFKSGISKLDVKHMCRYESFNNKLSVSLIRFIIKVFKK